LLQATRTLPIVFVIVIDPVGAGFVTSLVRPGGNATGFLMFEYGLSGKWLELLKQIAPGVARAAVVRDPAIASGIGQFAAIQAVAPALGVDLTPVDARDAPEIERAITAFARSGNAGLIVTASAVALRHRDLIVTLAARHGLPSRMHLRPLRRRRRAELLWADLFDQHRRAVGDVDRILRAKSRRNFRSRRRLSMRLIINLKTARGAGARHSTGRPRPRRQGDRISAGLAAIAYGTFETWVQSSSCKLSNLLCGTTSPLCSCSEQVRLFEHAT